jgi:predicted nuclease of predicted toxin-antitoxin system
MTFLVDQPVSPLLAQWLREAGHDAFHVRERGLSRASDEDIFALAVAESRIIITADLDFSRIIALSGRAGPGLILFRAGNITDDQMLGLLQETLARVPAADLPKSVVVVDAHALRIAPLPLRPDLAE